MIKQDLFDTILDLPAVLREQQADEIYQSLDSAEPGLHTDWIVEANHLNGDTLYPNLLYANSIPKDA